MTLSNEETTVVEDDEDEEDEAREGVVRDILVSSPLLSEKRCQSSSFLIVLVLTFSCI